MATVLRNSGIYVVDDPAAWGRHLFRFCEAWDGLPDAFISCYKAGLRRTPHVSRDEAGPDRGQEPGQPGARTRGQSGDL